MHDCSFHYNSPITTGMQKLSIGFDSTYTVFFGGMWNVE